MFAVIVHLCDGYFDFVAKSHKTHKKLERFFQIASRLPMDLQMVLCNRAFERPHSTISVADVNEAIFSVRSVFTDSRGRTGNERGACLLM